MPLETKIRTKPLDTQIAVNLLAEAVEKAVSKISIAADVATNKISLAADIASNKIASDALNATRVVANDAATAMKVNSATSSLDHDLLVELKTKMESIITDIKEYKNTKADKGDIEELKSVVYKNHSEQIRRLENKVANYFITLTIYSIAVAAMISLILFHITKVSPHV